MDLELSKNNYLCLILVHFNQTKPKYNGCTLSSNVLFCYVNFKQNTIFIACYLTMGYKHFFLSVEK